MLRNVSPFLNTCFIEDIKAIVSYLLTENVYWMKEKNIANSQE